MEPFITAYDGREPRLADGLFIAPGAVLEGAITLGARSSVWYGCVLRADTEQIVAGEDCNIQDGCILHADPGQPTILGDRVSLGHGAVVHGARVEDDVLIGIRSTVLGGAHIGSFSIIGAGALVPPGMVVPPGSFVVGVPGKVRRETSEDERALITHTHQTYAERARTHRDQILGSA